MIPFLNLRPALDEIRPDIDSAIKRVVDSGVFLNGPEVEAFEREWAAYCKAPYCIACASGTDALSIAGNYLWFGLTKQKAWEPVQIQGNTCVFTRLGIDDRNPTHAHSSTCVRIEISDVDKRGWPIEPERSIPVLLYGRIPPFDLAAVPIVDACQAHGWKPTCRAACFSFYPSKNLGCFGDGGAVVIQNERDYKHIRAQIWPGEYAKMHSRLSELNAAVLRTKLPHLDRWNAERHKLAAVYYNELPDWAEPACKPGEPTNHHIFAVLVDRRDELEQWLLSRGIGVKVHYREPLAELPGARRWCDRTLSLPMYPGLTAEQVREVCDTIRGFR